MTGWVMFERGNRVVVIHREDIHVIETLVTTARLELILRHGGRITLELFDDDYQDADVIAVANGMITDLVGPDFPVWQHFDGMVVANVNYRWVGARWDRAVHRP